MTSEIVPLTLATIVLVIRRRQVLSLLQRKGGANTSS
jgi:hypothetical protein